MKIGERKLEFNPLLHVKLGQHFVVYIQWGESKTLAAAAVQCPSNWLATRAWFIASKTLISNWENIKIYYINLDVFSWLEINVLLSMNWALASQSLSQSVDIDKLLFSHAWDFMYFIVKFEAKLLPPGHGYATSWVFIKYVFELCNCLAF